MAASHKTSAVVYLGAQPSKGEPVSQSLKERGLEFLRLSSSDVRYVFSPTIIQPNFGTYKNHLPHFLYAAISGVPTISSKNFFPIEYKGTLIETHFPPLVVSWSQSVSDETRDKFRKEGFRDYTMKNGKGGMIKESPSLEDARLCVSEGVVPTSPVYDNTINLSALRMAFLIMRIATAFVKMHQYPAFADKEHLESFSDSFTVKLESSGRMEIDDDDADGSEDEDTQIPLALKGTFACKLLTPFEEEICQVDDHYDPTYPGIMIAYDDDIARFDMTTVPAVIHDYFLGCLGPDATITHKVFEDLKRAWGLLGKTGWGMRVSHLFWCIRACLKLQTIIKPMVSKHNYVGCVMMGYGWKMTVQDVTYGPFSVEDLRATIRVVDPHSQALWKILQKLSFATNDDRIAAYREVRSTYRLRHYCQTLGPSSGEARDSLLAAAKNISFDTDSPLSITAANIALVLDAIRDPNFDLSRLGYLSPLNLLETDRKKVALSAFGNHAPSFRVPGGKRMSLDKSFETVIRVPGGKGDSQTRSVKKIAIQIVPLDLAYRHFEDVLNDRAVLNPFGNQRPGVASNNMYRTFEKDSCEEIIVAFRKLLNISLTEGGSKRKRDEGEEESGSKKQKMDFLDF